MHPRSPLLAVVAFAGLVSSLPDSASVYLFDRRHATPAKEPFSVSPNTGRLLFAQWLGLSRFHSLGDLEDVDLSALNEYGSRQFLLANSADGRSEIPRLLLLVEGVDDTQGELCSGSDSCSTMISSSSRAEADPRLLSLDPLPPTHRVPSLQISPASYDQSPGAHWNELLATKLSQEILEDGSGRRGCWNAESESTVGSDQRFFFAAVGRVAGSTPALVDDVSLGHIRMLCERGPFRWTVSP